LLRLRLLLLLLRWLLALALLVLLGVVLLLKLWRVGSRIRFWGRFVIGGIIRGRMGRREKARGVYDGRGREMIWLLRLGVLGRRTVVIGRLGLI
jgi:hypothetical protein